MHFYIIKDSVAEVEFSGESGVECLYSWIFVRLFLLQPIQHISRLFNYNNVLESNQFFTFKMQSSKPESVDTNLLFRECLGSVGYFQFMFLFYFESYLVFFQNPKNRLLFMSFGLPSVCHTCLLSGAERSFSIGFVLILALQTLFICKTLRVIKFHALRKNDQGTVFHQLFSVFLVV